MSSKADVVVGLQWGDEGKGRVVDFLAVDYDVVARFGGGDNAGHSIQVGDTKLALRVVPSGVLTPRADLFIGTGTVVGLDGLLNELDALARLGVDLSRIKISDRAHVVFPYHAAIDRARERALGGDAIGTTGRGIGPAYADKAARSGLTFGELADRARVTECVRRNLQRMTLAGENMPSEKTLLAETFAGAERVMPHVVDGARFMHRALEAGKRILAEGAQGSLLDISYGTYPYVTSTHTIAGAACTGLGIGPGAIGRVIGVVKAYCTRVGAGPFPSELHDERAERLRHQGHEFGTVTGRSRRCGWFDAVAARYAARLNGLTSAVITKLDVLSGFERIGVVTEYRVGGADADFGSAGDAGLETRIEYFEGWSEPLHDVRRIGDLPAAAKHYVKGIAGVLDVPLEMVSVGPERSQLAR